MGGSAHRAAVRLVRSARLLKLRAHLFSLRFFSTPSSLAALLSLAASFSRPRISEIGRAHV